MRLSIKKKIITTITATSLIINYSYSQTFNSRLLDSLINGLSLSNKAMGCLLITKNNNPIYSKAFGYKRINNQMKVVHDTNSGYLIGSATKMFTAVMIHQLVEEGKLSLDDRANKYISQIKSNSICIKHLLNHTSGLFDYVNDPESGTYLLSPINRANVLQKIGLEDLYFKPGTKTKYCNSGYLVLALIIEKVTGQSYSKNIEIRIKNKIDLKNTFCPSTAKSDFDQAHSYNYDLESNKYIEVKDYYLPNIFGVGDLVSTTYDMTKFITALNQGKLLSAASLGLMKTIGTKTQFGMGIMKIEFNDKMAYGHGGDTKGTHSGCFYFPQDSISVTYFLNTSDYLSNNFAIEVLSIVYNDVSFKLPIFNFKLEESKIKKYNGTYKNVEQNIKMKVSRPKTKESYLVVAVDSQKLYFEANGPNSFKNWRYDLDIRFPKENGGMVFYQNGDSLLLNKLIEPLPVSNKSSKK